MGLYLVEVVMRLEEEFETEIPDEIATSRLTPKDVIEYLLTKSEVKNKRMTRDDVADKVWQITEEECGIVREQFSENSRFVDDMRID